MPVDSLRARFPHTLPVWPVDDDGHCTCFLGAECRRPGKHADERAPADSPIYAVLAGPDGVIVVDVDVKGGVDGFAQLEPWDLPPTLEVHTPSGGRHLYFRHPGGQLANRKLDTAIDVRAGAVNEGGHAYVIGPGSPGYVRVDGDPCRVTPAEPYEVAEDLPVADAPALLLAWLNIDTDEREGGAITPIDETHKAWEWANQRAEDACKTFEASRERAGASSALMALVRRLVRTYALPDGAALEHVNAHWNPRCTYADGVTPWPWDDESLLRAFANSRARGRGESVVDSFGISRDMRKHTRPKALRNLLPAPAARKVHDPAHVYMYESGKLAPNPKAAKASFNEIVQHYATHPNWSGCWQFNSFADQVVCVDPPIRLDAEDRGLSETDISKLRSVLEYEGLLLADRDIQKAVHVAADANRFHPVRDYLASLPAGDPAIFHGLAKRLFGTDEPHADAFLEKTLVAAVRRILTPGCQVDTVLILHGPEQGEGKTQSVQALFGPEWTRRGLPSDLGNRDASHALLGFWGIELGEMTVLLRNESTTIKDFMSKQEETYRAYGNGERVRHLRQCIFIGTTNDDDFLRDATGNRRYWPISIPRGHDVPLEWLKKKRDELWSAALVLALDESYRHWFTRDEERELAAVRDLFVEVDGWHDKIATYLRGRAFVRSSDVFQTAIGGEIKDLDRRKTLRVTDTLRRLGCKSGVKEGAKGWIVPDALASSSVEKSPRFGSGSRPNEKTN